MLLTGLHQHHTRTHGFLRCSHGSKRGLRRRRGRSPLGASSVFWRRGVGCWGRSEPAPTPRLLLGVHHLGVPANRRRERRERRGPDVPGVSGLRGSSGGAAHCASSSDTIESLAVLRLTDSPRRQRASPGMASGPKLRERTGGAVSGERGRRVRVRRSVLALARHQAHKVLGEG